MFKKKKLVSTLVILSVVASLAIFGVLASAATISETLANAVDDTEVLVSGNVTSVDGNDFVISDGTAEIAVEAGPPWYLALTLAVGDSVTVTGEFDANLDGTEPAEIEAFSITQADGTVITIREGPGKPPWAGGPKALGLPGNRGNADDDDCDDVDEVDDDVDDGGVTGASLEQPGNGAGGRGNSELPGGGNKNKNK